MRLRAAPARRRIHFLLRGRLGHHGAAGGHTVGSALAVSADGHFRGAHQLAGLAHAGEGGGGGEGQAQDCAGEVCRMPHDEGSLGFGNGRLVVPRSEDAVGGGKFVAWGGDLSRAEPAGQSGGGAERDRRATGRQG